MKLEESLKLHNEVKGYLITIPLEYSGDVKRRFAGIKSSFYDGMIDFLIFIAVEASRDNNVKYSPRRAIEK